MSSEIDIAIGSARAQIESVTESTANGGVFPHFRPVDLLNAVRVALMAINTEQSVFMALRVYDIIDPDRSGGSSEPGPARRRA